MQFLENLKAKNTMLQINGKLFLSQSFSSLARLWNKLPILGRLPQTDPVNTRTENFLNV